MMLDGPFPQPSFKVMNTGSALALMGVLLPCPCATATARRQHAVTTHINAILHPIPRSRTAVDRTYTQTKKAASAVLLVEAPTPGTRCPGPTDGKCTYMCASGRPIPAVRVLIVQHLLYCSNAAWLWLQCYCCNVPVCLFCVARDTERCNSDFLHICRSLKRRGNISLSPKGSWCRLDNRCCHD
jgi:hypothetical protein